MTGKAPSSRAPGPALYLPHQIEACVDLAREAPWNSTVSVSTAPPAEPAPRRRPPRAAVPAPADAVAQPPELVGHDDHAEYAHARICDAVRAVLADIHVSLDPGDAPPGTTSTTSRGWGRLRGAAELFADEGAGLVLALGDLARR